MEPETRYTVIGAVVLALVGAAVFGYLWLSSSGRTEDFRYFTVYFEKQSLSGLQVGGNVHMRGITVGRVEDYSLSRDNVNRVKVDLRVQRDAPVLTSTKAAVSRNVLTGIAHINLDTPNAQAPELQQVPRGERFPVIAEGSSNLDQITDSVTHLAERANITLERASELLNADNQRAFSELVINLRDLSKNMNGRLDSFEQAARSMDTTAKVFQQSARDLTRSTQQLLVQMEPLPAQAGDTLREAQVTLRDFSRATQALERDIGQAVARLEGSSSKVLKRADDTMDLGLLELRATAAELRTSAELVSRTLDQLNDPRAALLGPGQRQFGPGEAPR